jgi:hypothetical protein
MIHVLQTIESFMPALLKEESEWKGIYADSKKPHLRRLWRQWYQYRINLHYFTECAAEEEFPHPHPWKMAVRVLEGDYLMGLGVDTTSLHIVPELSYTRFKAGDYYEMLDEDEWHAIRPLGHEALTVMVSGPVIYEKNRVHSNSTSRELSQAERGHLFEKIKFHYPFSFGHETAKEKKGIV